jgi:hypothetical protein
MEFDSGSLREIFGKTFPVKLFKEMKYEEVLERSLKEWEAVTEHFLKNELMCWYIQMEIWPVPFQEQMQNSH